MSYAKFKDLGNKSDAPINRTEKSIERYDKPPSKVIDIENIDHKNSLIAKNGLVVIDVWGDFCGPCKAIAPRYDELSIKYKNVLFLKEDVKLGLSKGEVRGVPCFIFYKNGQRACENILGGDINAVEQKIAEIGASAMY
jgi:thioredoxin 1